MVKKKKIIRCKILSKRICTSFRREVRVLIWFLYSSSRWLAYDTVTWTLCISIWKFIFWSIDARLRFLFFFSLLHFYRGYFIFWILWNDIKPLHLETMNLFIYYEITWYFFYTKNAFSRWFLCSLIISTGCNFSQGAEVLLRDRNDSSINTDVTFFDYLNNKFYITSILGMKSEFENDFSFNSKHI